MEKEYMYVLVHSDFKPIESKMEIEREQHNEEVQFSKLLLILKKKGLLSSYESEPF